MSQTPMGLGLLGDPNITFKTKLRWTFSATLPNGNIKEFYVKLSLAPTTPTEIDYLSAKAWIPDYKTRDTIEITALNKDDVDYEGSPFYKILSEFLKPTDGSEPPQKGTGILRLYKGNELLEIWELTELHPTEAHFVDMSYTEYDIVTTWKYKYAIHSSPKTTDGQVEPLLGGETETLPDR